MNSHHANRWFSEDQVRRRCPTNWLVGYESWLERNRLLLLDFDPQVVGITSQAFWLLTMVAVPFADFTWRHARRLAAELAALSAREWAELVQARRDCHSDLPLARAPTLRQLLTTGRLLIQLNRNEIAARRGIVLSGASGTGEVHRAHRTGPRPRTCESWTVLGEDLMPVEPVERFLAYLASIEKSPNTIKAYAHDLKDWMTYLDRHGVDWWEAQLEDVAGFVAWLRLPSRARDGRVVVLPTVEAHCSESSVNRKLSAVTSFCGFHARHGVDLSGLLITMHLRLVSGVVQLRPEDAMVEAMLFPVKSAC